MTIGEIIAALALYASNEDELLLMKSVYSIECNKEDAAINIYFIDANTADIMISKDGIKI